MRVPNSKAMSSHAVFGIPFSSLEKSAANFLYIFKSGGGKQLDLRVQIFLYHSLPHKWQQQTPLNK
jgi:hypothetical protein